MRLVSAFLTDVRFQIKHGFYTVYVIITGMYLIILSFLPDKVLPVATPLVLFSDPSVLGLFFIGGIIMLEKIQGVLSVVVVSPLRSYEYLLSKIVSLAFISVLASLAIAVFTPHGDINWTVMVLSVILTSGFFTMCGIMICAGCSTVNEYILKMVPYMLLLVVPCFSLLGFPFSWLFRVIPSVTALRLVTGAYTGITVIESVGLLCYLLMVNYLCFRLMLRIFERKIIYQD